MQDRGREEADTVTSLMAELRIARACPRLYWPPVGLTIEQAK